MNTLILADFSPASNLWFMGSIATMIAGALFVVIGYLLGILLFRRWKDSAEKLDRDNKKLARIVDARQRDNIEQRNSLFGNS